MARKKRKKEGGADASLLIGLILGIVIGAAIVVILTPEKAGGVEQSLESAANDTTARVQGAAEGATPR